MESILSSYVSENIHHPLVMAERFKGPIYAYFVTDWFRVIMWVVYFWAGVIGAASTYGILVGVESLDAPCVPDETNDCSEYLALEAEKAAKKQARADRDAAAAAKKKAEDAKNKKK